MIKHVIADYHAIQLDDKRQRHLWCLGGLVHSGYRCILTALVFALFLEQATLFSILLGLLDSVIH